MCCLAWLESVPWSGFCSQQADVFGESDSSETLTAAGAELEWKRGQGLVHVVLAASPDGVSSGPEWPRHRLTICIHVSRHFPPQALCAVPVCVSLLSSQGPEAPARWSPVYVEEAGPERLRACSRPAAQLGGARGRGQAAPALLDLGGWGGTATGIGPPQMVTR